MGLISGCSTEHEWERWEYEDEKKHVPVGLRASLIPTKYGSGDRKLSSQGPYRLVLKQSSNCDDSYLELNKIEVIKATGSNLLSTESQKGIIRKVFDEKCILVFASDEFISLDVKKHEKVTIEVSFVNSETDKTVRKIQFQFKPKYSRGTTNIPWFTT